MQGSRWLEKVKTVTYSVPLQLFLGCSRTNKADPSWQTESCCHGHYKTYSRLFRRSFVFLQRVVCLSSVAGPEGKGQTSCCCNSSTNSHNQGCRKCKSLSSNALTYSSNLHAAARLQLSCCAAAAVALLQLML